MYRYISIDTNAYIAVGRVISVNVEGSRSDACRYNILWRQPDDYKDVQNSTFIDRDDYINSVVDQESILLIGLVFDQEKKLTPESRVEFMEFQQSINNLSFEPV